MSTSQLHCLETQCSSGARKLLKLFHRRQYLLYISPVSNRICHEIHLASGNQFESLCSLFRGYHVCLYNLWVLTPLDLKADTTTLNAVSLTKGTYFIIWWPIIYLPVISLQLQDTIVNVLINSVDPAVICSVCHFIIKFLHFQIHVYCCFSAIFTHRKI